MGFTIVQIAGKRATCRWRPTKVTAETKSVEVQIDADARLAAAVGGAARFFAEGAGMLSEAAAEFQKAVLAACEEAFDHLSGEHPNIVVTLSVFPDRIEIAMRHAGGDDPAVGLDRIAGFAGAHGAPQILYGVDRVNYEASNGVAVTRLTKYLGHAPRMA